MADDFDVEAMLEAPYRKDEIKSSHANGHDDQNKKKRRSRSKSRSPGTKKRRSRSKDKKKGKKRSRSRERKPSRSRERHRSGSRSKERSGRYRARKSPIRKRSKSRSPFKKEKSPISNTTSKFDVAQMRDYQENQKTHRQPIDNLTPEERDARTVFCMQLAARIRARDLEDFFSAVGKVRDVRMISDRNSRRSKGIAYIEFVDTSSVPLAIGLTGQRLLGVPIIVQASQAEKNRAAAAANNLQKGSSGPMRLYVGSLHFNITEEMLRGIFEPFGKIEGIQLMMDSETGRSKGYGFISFADAECAKKALEQLNGFELAGRPMKVGHVTERSDSSTASSFLDNDELERTGIDLGTTGRLQLMARLAEGTGLKIPPAAQQALQMTGSIPFGNMSSQQSVPTPAQSQAMNLPSQPLATHCLQLSNLFNPQAENDPTWATEIQDDVIEECNKHGGIVHIYVDKNSTQGNVYVKCPSIPAAMATVNALHGRWFAGKMITAAYVPLPTYHNLFPDSVTAKQLLMPTRR
ncbi:RNA-binding protein 39b isoform X1 [Pleuronectes platessa]|uniref:RNA-binding protein 39b isoform X1 n=2 Tax=Pleuronectes platessa TaxID=8262 RepID=UPI00232A3987|nr:RNA-binding protein 39b isoform X1 [Pleuronectes platessa]XP_053280136.1 RNA-binding protein 39b isoform X1 [Pleuronectes platessa]XP_053280137.1 RNA-binding protein 39b isoform X1 [Pleuronectes platessa]XP_053280138.1 RNA-binding protein 39b isoform X1 [Pleuronectes platessa]XP_053280139.1 RNA-binding protein 39b isoform X1 [Pleuronectes platessa]XP_053280144.1 RNA-binding protein 39b isoform X1 [Pleuronectes platessa]